MARGRLFVGVFATLDDPKAYTRPWTLPIELALVADGELIEYVCENERDAQHMVGRSEWFHIGNDNPQRANTIGGFGHYEDELVKVNGQWFFTKRKIYNEGSARWQYKGGVNPAW